MTEKVSTFLPYGRQSIDDDDIEAVTRVLRSDYLTTGPAVTDYESAFAAHTGAKHAVSCSSGTAALHLAAMALDLGPGDAIIVPTITFLATANAARYVGAEVIFADVDATTGLLTPETMLDAIADAKQRGYVARAVFPVHLNGQCVDMERISDIAKAHNLYVVEDACHALGTTMSADNGEEIKAGACAYSDMATFSTHPVKAIATGEGGMVTTGNDELARRVSTFRNHGMSRDENNFTMQGLAYADDGAPNPWHYEMQSPGFNYRLSAIHATLGSSQLGKLERYVTQRRAIVAEYDGQIAKLSNVVQPVRRVAACNPAWHLYVVRIDFSTLRRDKASVMKRLNQQGVGSQVHYIPVHLQPYYKERYGATELRGAVQYFNSALSLPLFPDMMPEDVTRVVNALSSACEHD